MFSCGDNGAISMDATFGINDMKFSLYLTSKSSFKNLESHVIFYDKNNSKAPPQKTPSLCLDPCLDSNSNFGLKTFGSGIIIGTESSLKALKT
jgi:hypothetical protein